MKTKSRLLACLLQTTKCKKNTVIFIDLYQPISVRFFRFLQKCINQKQRRRKRDQETGEKNPMWLITINNHKTLLCSFLPNAMTNLRRYRTLFFQYFFPKYCFATFFQSFFFKYFFAIIIFATCFYKIFFATFLHIFYF